MQAEGRGRREIDIGRVGVVEHDAEHLADLAGGDRAALRLVEPMGALRRLAGRSHVEDASDRAVQVNDRAGGAIEKAGDWRHRESVT